MSIDDIKSLAATTGQYPALTQDAISGSERPDSGKALPPVGVPERSLEQFVDSLNAASLSVGRDLRFQVDFGSRRAVIQVLDRETGEIIRQIPPEKAEPYLSAEGAIALKLLDASA